jgi:NAD(P)-dependent dehydrogenase (short-subunit alcohol dehydrogenase family)
MTHVSELFDLTGRVAIVTGGSRGLGREIAEGLAEAGATVTITARREQWLRPTEDALRAAGLDVTAAVCDVTDPAAVQALVDRVIERDKALDILVNNAGISWGAPAETMPVEQFRRVLDTNATGAFLCSQAAAKHMIARQVGAIINTASVAGLVGSPPGVLRAAGYSASKGAVIALTRQLATEWAQYGIRVNAIAPGFFPTPMGADITQELRDSLIEPRTCLDSKPQNEWIRGALCFLASDEARFVTGHTLTVDGGWRAF